MSRMRTRTATRAGGAAHCTRTAGTAWSNRRTSTVSSASFTRGQPRVCRVAGELGVPVSAVNAAAAWESGMGAGFETPAEGRTPLGGDYS